MGSQGTFDQLRAVGGDGMNPKGFQFLGRGPIVDRPSMPFVSILHDLPGDLDRNVLVRIKAVRLGGLECCLLYTSPSPRDRQKSRMPSSA